MNLAELLLALAAVIAAEGWAYEHRRRMRAEADHRETSEHLRTAIERLVGSR